MCEEQKVVAAGLSTEVLDTARSVIVLALCSELHIANACVSQYRLLLF